MEELCKPYGLLEDIGGIIRVPFLVKGRLVAPPTVTRSRSKRPLRTSTPRLLM